MAEKTTRAQPLSASIYRILFLSRVESEYIAGVHDCVRSLGHGADQLD